MRKAILRQKAISDGGGKKKKTKWNQRPVNH